MGHFINFYLPYGSKPNDSKHQAQAIIAEAKKRLTSGCKGVAIIYSANYGQTEKIQQTYDAGDWNTETSGLNQADVMREMELLMGGTETDVQHQLQIAPITTMTYTDYGGHTHDEVIASDLKHIKTLLDNNWDILGWQNQDSTPKYAVGGKISNMSAAQKNTIQTTLSKYATDYPEK